MHGGFLSACCMPSLELVFLLPGLRAPCLCAVSCPWWLPCSCDSQNYSRPGGPGGA